MKIAYSCAGEGFGHAARMAALYPILSASHDVSIFAPIGLEAFLHEKLGKLDYHAIPCFTFEKKEDRILLFRTAKKGVKPSLEFLGRVKQLSRSLRRLGIEAVISDFEPYLAWAGRLAGIPVLQMNHPGIITRKLSLDPRSWPAVLGALLMEGLWDERVHISFYGGEAGPLYRKSLFRNPPRDGGYILLNLKESFRRKVCEVLRDYPQLPFKLFPQPGANFEEALCSCKAVISSAGHQIIAESMRLGKPILVIPQRGQWEQILNARMLEKLGRGMKTTLGSLKKDLSRFLDSLDAFKLRSRGALPPGFSLDEGMGSLLCRVESFLARRVGVILALGAKDAEAGLSAREQGLISARNQ